MDLYIKEAVLHMFDRNQGAPVYSSVPLDLGVEYIFDYVGKKIAKISTAQTKTGTLTTGSKFSSIVQEMTSENFIDKSVELVDTWSQIYNQSEDAPSSDILVARFEVDNVSHIAFIKLGYKESFTHFVETTEDGVENKLIVNRAILPTASAKPDEAIAINQNTLTYELIEKKYEFSGVKHAYFSEYVIESEPTPSIDESVREMKKIAKSISKRYDEDDYEILANVQNSIYDSIEEVGFIDQERIAEEVFGENVSAKLEYKDEIASALPVTDNSVNDVREISEKKFGKQKLKMDNGIELIVPLEIYRDVNAIEFISNPDGTVSITIKNIEKIVNKL